VRRLILPAAVAALFLVALPVAPVAAAPPEQVTIQGPAFFAGTGEFTATGPAVASGTMCDAGTIVDLYVKSLPVRRHSEGNVNLRVLKQFTCDDGSGTFLALLRVRIRPERTTTFRWFIFGGTGDYVHLRGRGRGHVDHAIFDGPDQVGVWDVYRGRLH